MKINWIIHVTIYFFQNFKNNGIEGLRLDWRCIYKISKIENKEKIKDSRNLIEQNSKFHVPNWLLSLGIVNSHISNISKERIFWSNIFEKQDFNHILGVYDIYIYIKWHFAFSHKCIFPAFNQSWILCALSFHPKINSAINEFIKSRESA